MNVEYCCLDASAFSIGFAVSHSNTLIVEETENVISDYVNSIKTCVVTEPHTDKSRSFTEYIRKSGCISDKGIIDSASLAPVAAEYALNLNLNILLGTKIVSIEKKSKNVHIKIYTNSGLQTIVCNKIIHVPKTSLDFKLLNCIVSETDFKTLSKLVYYGGIIKQSFEKDEFIVSLPFSSDSLLNEARIKFADTFKKCFGTSVKIDAFATDFEYSNGFTGIIEEFEAGENYDIL